MFLKILNLYKRILKMKAHFENESNKTIVLSSISGCWDKKPPVLFCVFRRFFLKKKHTTTIKQTTKINSRISPHHRKKKSFLTSKMGKQKIQSRFVWKGGLFCCELMCDVCVLRVSFILLSFMYLFFVTVFFNDCFVCSVWSGLRVAWQLSTIYNIPLQTLFMTHK